MPFVGALIPANVVGVEKDRRAARTRAENRPPAPGAPERPADEAELTIQLVESAGGVRSIKPNEAEESHEDRQEHAYYTAGGTAGHSGDAPTLDIKG